MGLPDLGVKPRYDIISPSGLDISVPEFNQVRMKIRNLSPETDGYIYWRTKENQDKDAGSARFTMRPDCPEWQEVVCYIDSTWQGIIDQIRIRLVQMGMRGDIWIDWIKIVNGQPAKTPARPDLCSDKVVPEIKLPGISQEHFQDAFKILDECLVTDVPMKGFNYPFLAPGGRYGQSWWQLDASLNIAGAKWVNQKFVENMMRGFAGVQSQNPDGRIDLWGGSAVRGMPANVSSLPRFFEAAFDVAVRTDDKQLQELIFDMMKKYLGYWFSPLKRDAGTGLITAVFEESFSDKSFGDKKAIPGTLAPIDLNVAVAIGCYNTCKLARYLDYEDDSQFYNQLFEQLCQAINKYLWCDKTNAYYNYDTHNKVKKPRFICTTFDPLRYNIAPLERIDKLVSLLVNPEIFNWGIHPVTSIALTEPEFVEATGIYDGTAWFGDVWTLRNMLIINGLEDAGKHNLASELAWATIKMFNNNFSEYVVPGTGSGEGVARYGWTASQYIQAIIENIFGIRYNRFEKRLIIFPHIPKECMGHEISIQNLFLPFEKTRLSLNIDCKSSEKLLIDIKFKGTLPDGKIVVMLPELSSKNFYGPDNNDMDEFTNINYKNYKGVEMPVKQSVHLVFK